MYCLLSWLLAHYKKKTKKHTHQNQRQQVIQVSKSIYRTHTLPATKTNQIFYMALHATSCSADYIGAPNKGIEQACS